MAKEGVFYVRPPVRVVVKIDHGCVTVYSNDPSLDISLMDETNRDKVLIAEINTLKEISL